MRLWSVTEAMQWGCKSDESQITERRVSECCDGTNLTFELFFLASVVHIPQARLNYQHLKKRKPRADCRRWLSKRNSCHTHTAEVGVSNMPSLAPHRTEPTHTRSRTRTRSLLTLSSSKISQPTIECDLSPVLPVMKSCQVCPGVSFVVFLRGACM